MTKDGTDICGKIFRKTADTMIFQSSRRLVRRQFSPTSD